MPEDFQFDVFLSHSSKDKPVVRELAARLQRNGVRVWLDEEQIKVGDSIPAKIEEGLEGSRLMVLCMSINAFGSDWSQLESGTFRFRDPLNKERRFIPLRLDDTPIKGSLAQFLYISWLPANREQEYLKLLEACCQPAKHRVASSQVEVTVGDANAGIAVSQAVGKRSGQRPTIWVIGSYSELETQELALTRKLVSTLGSAFGARGIRLVSGKSVMLDDLASYCRNVAMSLNPRGPLPIILDGKLRQTDLRMLFRETIGIIPDLAIVIGGGISRGRVSEECVAADKAGIPVLPLAATGGAAARVKLTAHKAANLYKAPASSGGAIDVNDLVAVALNAVECYVTPADHHESEGRPIRIATAANSTPPEILALPLPEGERG